MGKKQAESGRGGGNLNETPEEIRDLLFIAPFPDPGTSGMSQVEFNAAIIEAYRRGLFGKDK